MLKIVRWEGGYAGDSILSSVLSANKKIKSNISYYGISQKGRANCSTNKKHILSSLAYLHKHDYDIDLSKLDKHIQSVINDTNMHIVRTHCYNNYLDKYIDYITDIVSTNKFLSFTTAANFYKTNEATKKSLKNKNKFYTMLEQKDTYEADMYMIYCIAVSHYNHNSTKLKSRNQILLDNWINLKYNSILGYDFDKEIHKQWIDTNQYILDKKNEKIDKICELVKQEISYNKIRKLL